MKMTLLLLLGALLFLPTPAAAISCVDAGDVTALPAGCDLGPLHFDQFALSVQGQLGFEAAVFIGAAPFTNVTDEQTSGGQATLGFQVAHTVDPLTGGSPGLADLLLSYRASTLSGDVLLGGIGLANGGVGPVAVHERVCRTAFTGTGACLNGGLLADLLVPANSFDAVRFTPDVDRHEVFILKDIMLNEGAFISDIANAHELGALDPVPEPATLLLFGTTLAGVGLWWRRRRRD